MYVFSCMWQIIRQKFGKYFEELPIVLVASLSFFVGMV